MGATDAGRGKSAIAEADRPARLKVFLSYSRKDQEFAAELLSGLELLGFDAYLDKEDIAPGEPWEERLGGLIRSADTVVFVLSPASVASKHCSWEVIETVKLAKRLVPVIWKMVPDADVPADLRRLNYIFFGEGQSYAKSLGQLAQALKVNLAWIREHSRLAELAENWVGGGKPDGLLLRGGEIEAAKIWAATRPADAPQVTAEQHALIDFSIAAAEAEHQKRAALQWRAKAGTIAAAIIFAMGTAVSSLAYVQAFRAKQMLAEQNASLRSANIRLERKMSLRVAPSGTVPYFVGPNWYQVASDYSGAIVKLSGIQGAIGSGFVVKGSSLYDKWGPAPVLVTASFVVSRTEGLNPAGVTLSFPGLGETPETIKLGPSLWEEPFDMNGPDGARLGIAIFRIENPLPFGTKVIDKIKTSDIPGLPDSAQDSAAGDAKGGYTPHPLATVGYGGLSTGFAIFLSHLLGVAERDATGAPVRLGYTHATEGGVGGAPVFDIETGELMAVHQSGTPLGDGRKMGNGASMARVVEAIKAKLDQPAPVPEAK